MFRHTCNCRGSTVEEVKEKMHVAIKGYFEAFPKEQDKIRKRMIYSTPIPP